MTFRAIAPWICAATFICAPGRSLGAKDEQAFGEWKVEAVSPTTVRASTHGTKVYGHMFAIFASVKACEEPLFWISWSAQGPDRPAVDRFEKGEPVQLAIAVGGKAARIELPLVAARPLTTNITVFAMTNAVVPKDLLGDLSTADTVTVTVEKPGWLADHIRDPQDSFALGGFASALAALKQRCSAIAVVEACPGVDLTVRAWARLAGGAAEARSEYLAKLGACGAREAGFRARVDDVAVDALDAVEAVPEESRRWWAGFVADVLRLNANAGDASSQHNLAGMYNSRPGSALARSFTQDHGRFAYWTRRAASQGEPRALFNLAVRLAGDDASSGVQPDPVLGYQAILALEPMLIRYQRQLDQLRPAVERTRQALEKKLGDDRASELKKGAGAFSLTTLAPAGAEPALGAEK